MTGTRNAELARPRGRWAWGALAVGLPVLALLSAALGLGAPTVASAEGKNDPRTYLRAPGCPVAYRTEKTGTYDRERQVEALHWRLKVHNQVLEMRPPIDWKRNPYDSKAFDARLADLSFLDQLLFIYVASTDFQGPKKLRALRMAREIVLHWVRAEGQGEVNSETWTDRVAARRATFVAFVARAAACEGALLKRDARSLLASIREHGRWLRNPAHYRTSNHGLSIDLALAALGRYLPQDRWLQRGAERGERRYKRTFYGSFNEAEGVWLEHSMGYYAYAINLVDDYLRVVDATDSELRAARQQLVTSLAWLTAPDERMAQFGDTSIDKPQAEVRAEAARQGGLWVAPASGYAVVKDPAAGGWLAIASSYHSGVHKHSDELSFELYESGHRIVQDTGQYHKDRDRYFDFQRSPGAHSTLTVDGEEIDSEDTPPYGSGIYAWGEGDGWYAVWATNPVLQSARAVIHARLFLYKPGYALIVGDRVLADRLHTYSRHFQLGHRVNATPEGNELLLSAPGLRGALTSFSTVGEGELGVVEGRDTPLAGWTYPHFREQKPRPTASWSTIGQNVDHLATLSLDGRDLRAALGTPLGDDTTIVLQDDEGATLASLHVVRSGSAVTVDQTP